MLTESGDGRGGGCCPWERLGLNKETRSHKHHANRISLCSGQLMVGITMLRPSYDCLGLGASSTSVCKMNGAHTGKHAIGHFYHMYPNDQVPFSLHLT